MDQIAWRSSALTRLLRCVQCSLCRAEIWFSHIYLFYSTALNGRCKTIMIAAISPSLSEYPVTQLSQKSCFIFVCLVLGGAFVSAVSYLFEHMYSLFIGDSQYNAIC